MLDGTRNCYSNPVTIPVANRFEILSLAAPATVMAGSPIAVHWTGCGSSSIPHANLHYRIDGNGGEQGTTVLSLPSGAFDRTASIPTDNLKAGARITIRGHLMVGSNNVYSTPVTVTLTGLNDILVNEALGQ